MSDEGHLFRLTPNQVVAYNLRLARRMKGWTQEEAARRLEPFLGARWSAASYSATERSPERPDRIRNFTADELVAFAACFDLPVTFFFIPPEKDPAGRVAVVGTPGMSADEGLCAGDLIELVFGNPENFLATKARIRMVLDDLGEDGRSEGMELLRSAHVLLARQAVRDSAEGNLDEYAQALREVADILDTTHREAEARLEQRIAEALRHFAEKQVAELRASTKLSQDEKER